MIPSRPRKRGVALIMALLCLGLLVAVFAMLTKMGLAERGHARTEERRLRALWLAESGLERAWAKLVQSPSYRGETWSIPAETLKGKDGADVRITIQPLVDEPSHLRVTSQADYPREGTSRTRQTRTAVFSINAENSSGADR